MTTRIFRRSTGAVSVVVMFVCSPVIGGEATRSPTPVTQPETQSARQTIESIWGGQVPRHQPNVRSIDWWPRESPVYWRRNSTGELEIGGTDPKRVAAVRELRKRPLVYLPVIEEMTAEALEDCAYPQSSTTGRHFLSGIERSLFRDPGTPQGTWSSYRRRA